MRYSIIIILLSIYFGFGQQKIMPRDLSRETKVLMADTAKAIAHDTSAAIQAQLRSDIGDSTEFEVVSDNAQLKPAYKDVVIPKGDLKFRGNFGLYQDKKLVPGDKWAFNNLYNSKQSLVRINPIGGGYRSVFIGNSIFNQVAYNIANVLGYKYGRLGAGFDPLGSPKYGTHVTITKTTGWVSYNDEADNDQEEWGVSGNSLKGGIGDTLLYSPRSTEFFFSDVRIWYLQTTGGGSFDIIIGTDTTSVDTDGESSIRAVRYSLLDANTSHDITINNIETATVTLYGIETFLDKNQNGFTPYFCSEGGSTAEQWCDRMAFFRTFIDSIDCDNINILLGANDAGTYENTAAEYMDDMTRIVDTLIAIKPNTNIVLITQYPRDTGNGTGVEDTDFTALVEEYRDSLYSLADSRGCSVWDLQKYWPTFDEAFEEGLYTDQIHPSDHGSTFIAEGIADMLNLRSENHVGKYGYNYLGGQYGFSYGSAALPTINFFRKNSNAQSVMSTTGFYGISQIGLGFAISGVKAIEFGVNAIAGLTFYPDATRTAAIRIMRHGATNSAVDFGVDAGNATYFNTTNGDIIFKRTDTEKVRINATGLRLGANTGATLVKIDLYPTSADSMRFIITNPTASTKDTSDWIGLK